MSQESKQAQEAWSRLSESFDANLNYAGYFIAGKDALKAAIKATHIKTTTYA